MKLFLSIIFSLFCFTSILAQPYYYRSAATGNWNALTTWEYSTDNATWNIVTVTQGVPGATNTINTTIQAAHTVSVTTVVSVTPQTGGIVTVNGTLHLTGNNLTIVNGTAAVDFINNGIVTVNASRILTLNAQSQNSAGANINNSGTCTINLAAASFVNNGTFTNNGTLLYQNGTLFNNTNALNNNGAFTITPLNYSGTITNLQTFPGSTVTYNSGAGTQTIVETDYYNLTVSGSHKSLILTGNRFIRNNLTIGLGNATINFNITGAGNSIICNGNITLNQGNLIPANGVTIDGNGGANSLIGNGGVYSVNNLGTNVLASQYSGFETWNLAAANAVRYSGTADQEVEELLPDGSSYGGIDVSTGGTKTLTLTGVMLDIKGNFSLLTSAILNINGAGVLGVSGNLIAADNSTLNTIPAISINGVGAANIVDLNNTNDLIRTFNITKSSLFSQISGFESWETMNTTFATLTVNFNSATALTVESLPNTGTATVPGTNAYREINISGNRGSNVITFDPSVIRIQRVFTVSGTYGSIDMTGNTLWFESLSGAPFMDNIPNIPYNQVDIKSITTGCARLNTGDYTMNSLNIYSGAYLDFKANGNSLTIIGNLFVEGAGDKILLSSNVTGSTLTVKGTTTCAGSGVQRLFSKSIPYNNNLGLVYLYDNIINTFGTTSTDTLILNNAFVNLNLLGTTPKTLSGPARYYVKDNVKVNNPAGWTFDSDVFMCWTTAKDFQVLQPLTINAGKNLDSYGATPSGSFSHNLHNPTLITVGSFATQVKNWNQLTATIQYVSNTGNNANDGLTIATAKRNMQNAHAVLSAGGRLIVLNNITDTLYVTKQIHIEGQGKTTTIISPIAKPAIVSCFSFCSGVPCNVVNFLRARNNGIITFAQGSDSSTIKSLKLAHNNQENRTAIMIQARVKDIEIDDIWIETSGNGSFKGSASYPYSVASPQTYCGLSITDTDNDNFGKYVCQVAAQYYSSFRLKNSDLTVTASNVKLDRSVAGYVVGTNVDSVIVDNNTINNNSQFATQCVWMQEVTNVQVRNNTILGANFPTSSDVFGVDISTLNNRFTSQTAYVKNNTITTNATHQICFKLCYSGGKVYAQNNTITTTANGTRLAMGVGIGVEATLNATIEGNTFNAPASGNFIHVFVDNNYSTASGLGQKTAPILNIWGNTFNTNASAVAARAIMFRRTELDPSKYYQSINMIGSSANVFAQNMFRYVDIERGLFDPANGITTIDMSSQNSFPAIETGYEIEDKITHYLDSRRNESENRPLVNFQNKHFYLTAQQSSAAGDVINTSFPICNRSIQDALDLVPPASNDYWIHADSKLFKSGSEMTGAELEYGASTQVENTINFTTPVYFVGRDTFNTVINRHITVNLANPAYQITQYGCFAFGKDGVGGVKNFTVTQGDWDLNTKVIIFASVNALLVESVGNTIKDNYAKNVPGGIRGYIQTTRNLNAPSSVNVAGFGAVITSAENMGSTVIRRGHNEQILPSPQVSVFRYFDIHPTNNGPVTFTPSLNATLVFKYDSSERNNRVEANLKQWRNSDPVLISSWAEQMPLATWSLQGGTSGSSSVTFTSIPSFSRWTVAEGSVVLPVSELAFTAQLVDKKVKLDWNTKNEQSLAHFEIERSVDLQTFEYISTKMANGSNGVSAQYHDWDNQPKKGVSYYRLKLVNIDGSFSYSNVETIVWEDPGFISIYPNPAIQQFNIALGNTDEKSVQIQLIDIQGKIISDSQRQVNNGVINYPTENLAQGIYVVKVITQQSVLTGRVVVNK